MVIMKVATILPCFRQWLVLVFLCAGCLVSEAEETHVYRGAVGAQVAIFKLTWHDDSGLSGTYYCPGGSGKVYQLVGGNQNQGEIILSEFTPGTVKATATCKLHKKIEDGKIVWRGVMVNHDGRVKTMHFSRDR
jgi:hypothetical protein